MSRMDIDLWNHWRLLSCLEKVFMEPQGRLNSQQLKDLSDELAALMKQQSDARLTEVYVRMTQQEIKAFDLRKERISKIHVILSEHDAKR
jgi:hypothetical protein